MELPTMTKKVVDKNWETFFDFYFSKLNFVEFSTSCSVILYHLTKIPKNGFVDDLLRCPEKQLARSHTYKATSSSSCYLDVRTTTCQRQELKVTRDDNGKFAIDHGYSPETGRQDYEYFRQDRRSFAGSTSSAPSIAKCFIGKPASCLKRFGRLS